MAGESEGAFRRVRLRLELLCCLGLEGQSVIATLLREVGGLVFAGRKHFFWLDEQLQPRQSCSYPSPLSAQDSALREWGFPVPDGSIKQALASQTFHSLNDALTLSVSIRTGEQQLGLLILHREQGDLIFSGRERQRLAQMVPHIERALTPSAVLQAPWVDTDEEGLIVAEVGGRICYLSTEAQRLLSLASAQGGSAATTADTLLPESILPYCNTLVPIPGGEQDAAVTAAWCHENASGRFLFRIHRLGPAPEFPYPPLLGISIRRQEPLPLKLLRGIHKLPLSFREMQFCLVLASGYCQAAIAEHMHISAHTAIAHRRHIYTKLAVHNRAGLMGMLLAL